jgi:hypothetical protein
VTASRGSRASLRCPRIEGCHASETLRLVPRTFVDCDANALIAGTMCRAGLRYTAAAWTDGRTPERARFALLGAVPTTGVRVEVVARVLEVLGDGCVITR